MSAGETSGPRAARVCAMLCLSSFLALGVRDPPAEDPKVKTVLEGFSSLLRTARAYEVQIAVQLQTLGRKKMEFKQEYTLRVQRPNLLSLVPHDSVLAGVKVVCDGKEVFSQLVYGPGQPSDEFTLEAAPTKLEGIASWEKLGKSVLTLQTIPGVDLLLADGQYETIRKKYPSLRYLGTGKLDDVECQKVELMNDSDRLEVWISGSGDPVLHRVVWSEASPNDEKKKADTQEASGMRAVVEYRKWRTLQEFPSDAFRIEAPSAAKRVEIPPKPPSLP